MADRLTGGTLAEELKRYRKVNIAWAAIARLLQEEHGVEVSAETLQAWARELGVPEYVQPEAGAVA